MPCRTKTRTPELVLELPDLLADAGLRREQRLGGVRHVEPVVDDRAQIAELLQVQAIALMPKASAEGRLESAGIITPLRRIPAGSTGLAIESPSMAQLFQVHPANPQPRLIRQAAAILRDGGVIAYPTDSSYALGCHIGDAAAAQRIRQIRGVDERHPADAGAARSLRDRPFRAARQLAIPDRPPGDAGRYTFMLPGDARGAAAPAASEAQHDRRARAAIIAVVQALLAELGRADPVVDADPARRARAAERCGDDPRDARGRARPRHRRRAVPGGADDRRRPRGRRRR